MSVVKAVFPVAGLGTRILPATKALAKEMLPLVDKPVIQHAVEEALSAGLKELIFVTSAAKEIIRAHFQRNAALEAELARRGKHAQLERTRDILPPGVTCRYVVQNEPLGLGHAILCAKPLVGDEPFAVILPDELLRHDGGACLRQLMALHERKNASAVAVGKVPPEEVSRYGIVGFVEDGAGGRKMESAVEKPAPEDAPSTLGLIGRYVFTPRIMALLETTPKGAGNEIQLTDAIAALLREQDVYLCEVESPRSDCGSLLGYLKANVERALEREDIGAEFRAWLTALLQK